VAAVIQTMKVEQLQSGSHCHCSLV